MEIAGINLNEIRVIKGAQSNKLMKRLIDLMQPQSQVTINICEKNGFDVREIVYRDFESFAGPTPSLQQLKYDHYKNRIILMAQKILKEKSRTILRRKDTIDVSKMQGFITGLQEYQSEERSIESEDRQLKVLKHQIKENLLHEKRQAEYAFKRKHVSMNPRQSRPTDSTSKSQQIDKIDIKQRQEEEIEQARQRQLDKELKLEEKMHNRQEKLQLRMSLLDTKSRKWVEKVKKIKEVQETQETKIIQNKLAMLDQKIRTVQQKKQLKEDLIRMTVSQNNMKVNQKYQEVYGKRQRIEAGQIKEHVLKLERISEQQNNVHEAKLLFQKLKMDEFKTRQEAIQSRMEKKHQEEQDQISEINIRLNNKLSRSQQIRDENIENVSKTRHELLKVRSEDHLFYSSIQHNKDVIFDSHCFLRNKLFRLSKKDLTYGRRTQLELRIKKSSKKYYGRTKTISNQQITQQMMAMSESAARTLLNPDVFVPYLEHRQKEIDKVQPIFPQKERVLPRTSKQQELIAKGSVGEELVKQMLPSHMVQEIITLHYPKPKSQSP